MTTTFHQRTARHRPLPDTLGVSVVAPQINYLGSRTVLFLRNFLQQTDLVVKMVSLQLRSYIHNYDRSFIGCELRLLGCKMIFLLRISLETTYKFVRKGSQGRQRVGTPKCVDSELYNLNICYAATRVVYLALGSKCIRVAGRSR